MPQPMPTDRRKETFQLVCTVTLTNLEPQALSDEGVEVVGLGASFKRWMESRIFDTTAVV